MRALKLVSAGKLSLEQVPEPTIGPGDVLVKVAGAGLCHSDLHILHAPQLRIENLTLGHESAGTVAAMADDVAGFAEGDPVLVYLVWACGTCRACVQGRDNVCITAGGRRGPPPCPGLGPDGGMADYIRVNARYLEPLGTLDPVTAGPLADAGLTPMHAINGARHRLTPGSTAVVVGVGGLGHMGIQILRATSSVRVIAVDIDASKLEIARTSGADITVLAGSSAAEQVLDLTDGYGAEAVFDFVGTQPTLDLAAAVIAPDGALRVIGVGGGSLAWPPNLANPGLPWGVDARLSYGGTRQDQRMVIDLAKQGRISVEAQLYSLDNGIQAFTDLDAGKVRGRAILVP